MGARRYGILFSCSTRYPTSERIQTCYKPEKVDLIHVLRKKNACIACIASRMVQISRNSYFNHIQQAKSQSTMWMSKIQEKNISAYSTRQSHIQQGKLNLIVWNDKSYQWKKTSTITFVCKGSQARGVRENRSTNPTNLCMVCCRGMRMRRDSWRLLTVIFPPRRMIGKSAFNRLWIS